MHRVSHAARLIQPASIDYESRRPTLSDVPQRRARCRRGRARGSAAQPERAIRELHELPHQDSRVSYEPGVFPLTNLSDKKARNAQNIFATTESFMFESLDDRCSRTTTGAFTFSDKVRFT